MLNLDLDDIEPEQKQKLEDLALKIDKAKECL